MRNPYQRKCHHCGKVLQPHEIGDSLPTHCFACGSAMMEEFLREQQRNEQDAIQDVQNMKLLPHPVCNCGKPLGIDQIGAIGGDRITCYTDTIDEEDYLLRHGVYKRADLDYLWAMVLVVQCNECGDEARHLALETTPELKRKGWNK